MTDRITHEQAKHLAGGIIAEQFPATSADLLAYIEQQCAAEADTVSRAEHEAALKELTVALVEAEKGDEAAQARVAELEAQLFGLQTVPVPVEGNPGWYSLEPAPQWIPVAQPPAEGQMVFFCNGHGARYGVFSDGQFFRWGSVYPMLFTEVTHWLPAPPLPDTDALSYAGRILKRAEKARKP